jgi:hypothetical protein
VCFFAARSVPSVAHGVLPAVAFAAAISVAAWLRLAGDVWRCRRLVRVPEALLDPSTRCVRAVAAMCASHVRRVFSCTWQAPMRDVS